MRGLRIICIFALVALLVLGSIGTVFAKVGPPADKPGNGPHVKVEKQVFAGNVTDVVGGNVTIATIEKGSVIVTLTDDTQYKIPSVMNKWSDCDKFINALGGNIIALEGRRVVALAGNVTGEWVALKLLVLPVPGTPPRHAHRTGLVIEFNKPSESSNGNITIIDVHGGNHTFVVGNSTITVYHPEGIGAGNITADPVPPYSGASFVTVVTTGDPKIIEPPPVAKAIVLHASRPEEWPKPAP